MQSRPFSSIVGNDGVKRALVCALSSPDLGSILICGPKGTGKSELANSVGGISGDRKIVVLPLNVTEDRLFGGMDVEKTLKDGKRAVSESVLMRAHGNNLMVENLNLFPEYLTHRIMNISETKFNTVEREGISYAHDCDFLLIATMNPEEGGISEHLLDRFDLCVFTSNIDDEAQREEVILRYLQMRDDPAGFLEIYSCRDAEIAEKISKSRARTRFTRVPLGYCEAISEVCNQLKVAGHRGDLSVMNAACALAALDDRDVANMDDLKIAVAMCLEHRRNDRDEPPENRDEEPQEEPPEEPPEDDDRDNHPEDDKSPQDNQSDNEPREDESEEQPQDDDCDLPPPPPPESDQQEQIFSIGDVFKVIDYMPNKEQVSDRDKSGKHTSSLSKDGRGKCIGFRIPKGKINDIALCASIRAAAPYQVIRDHSEMAIVLKKEDLREKVRKVRKGNDILFLVDGSGSIGAQKRMVAVKGAILSMLKDAYQKRDEIGMAVFRGNRAEELLPLTKSVLKAYKTLADIPTGGRTPLTHGLLKGYDILKSSTSEGSRPTMVILSDGRCNVAYTKGKRPIDEMLETASSLSGTNIRFVVIDTEFGNLKFGLALELCRALNGTYLRLEDLNAEYIERSVKMAMRSDV